MMMMIMCLNLSSQYARVGSEVNDKTFILALVF